MGSTEHIFKSKRPRWAWPAAIACFGLAALAGAVFGWWAALGPAIAGASVLGEASGRIVLERDETGTARWIRSRGGAVDLARLAALKFVQGGYSLRDAAGGHLLVPLDERLRHEAATAAHERRLQLDAVTERALLRASPGHGVLRGRAQRRRERRRRHDLAPGLQPVPHRRGRDRP